MLLAEKYAVADFNAVKSYERKKGIEEGEEKGANQTIYKLVSSGELSIDAGAKYLGISVDDLKNQMLVCGFSVPETKKEVQNMLLAEKYAVADLNAVKSYERKKGIKEGEEKGIEKGRNERDFELAAKWRSQGKSEEEIKLLLG